MADRLGVSLRFLETFFRERFGVTPHHWIVRVRMTRAAGLLTRAMPVRIVAVKVGYKQVSHFSREFKRYFGLPPKRYMLAELKKASTAKSIRSSRLDKVIRI